MASRASRPRRWRIAQLVADAIPGVGTSCCRLALVSALVMLIACDARASTSTSPSRPDQQGCETGRLCGWPNDPFFGREWWLDSAPPTTPPPHSPPPLVGSDIDVLPAWQRTLGDSRTRLAILDTGIDSRDADLRDRILSSATLVGNNGNVGDQNGHGTFVAGIAAASIDDDAGIAGVAPRASVLDIKMVTTLDPGETSCANVAGAIMVALQLHAQVISISFESSDPCPTEQAAVAQAWDRGALVVASVGETGQDVPTYPAAYPHVLSVAGTDDREQILPLSDRGASWVDLAAPGGPLLSDVPHAGYSWGTGTSFAAPLVSGAAALIWSSVQRQDHGGEVNAEVAGRLLQYAERIRGTGTLWRYGQLDVCRALLRSARACRRPAPPAATDAR